MTTSQIVEKFLLFRDGKTSLEEFEDWLVSGVWGSDEGKVSETAWELILRFFEYSSKHLGREELIAEITELLSLQEPYVSPFESIDMGASWFLTVRPDRKKRFLSDDKTPQPEFLPLETYLVSHQTSKYLAA